MSDITLTVVAGPTVELTADAPGAVTVTVSSGGGGGVTDHGALTGLADDDHPQYVRGSLVDAAGDLLVGSAADTVARLGIGTAGQVLRVNSGATAPEWAAQSGLVVNTVAAAGSTETLAGDTYNVHDVTLDESVTFTFTTSAAVAQFTLILRQDGSGGNSVTWPASVKWHSLTAPTILTTASAVHVLEFLTVDTGTTWRGFLASSAVS